MQKPNKLLSTMPNTLYVTEHNGEYVASAHAWVGTEPYIHRSLVIGLLNTIEYIQQLDSGDPNYRTKVEVLTKAALKHAGVIKD